MTAPAERAASVPPAAWAWLLGLAGARFLLHMLSNGEYGFHRDELAVLADARQLAWGYVAYPPLTPLLGRIGIELGGMDTTGFRLFAALAQACAMLVTGLIARELGGARWAQVAAAIAVACAPISMLQGAMLQYVGIEYLCWVLVAWMLLRLVNSGDPRWWLGIGLVVGLGMMTRYTSLFWALGLGVGILATPLRRALRSPWPWAGAALSLLVFAPNAWWQWQHDFVYLEFARHLHERDVRIGRTEGFLAGQFLVGASPVTAPLWLSGLIWLLVSGAAARWRMLAWMYLVPLGLFWLAGGRDYYVAPGYPMLLAAGAVTLQHGLPRLRPAMARATAVATAALLTLSLGITGLIGLPVSPVGSFGWRASRSVHDNFAEQVGWPELVAQVARIYHALPEGERRRTAIFANNYGEAGAIDLYGPRLGLPRAISGINSYWYRGYGDPPPTTVIVLGDDAQGISDTPGDCRLAGRVRIPHGVENEESGHPDIYLCRNLRIDWAQAWPLMRSFG